MTFRHIISLGNSIVGVSLLSMPYCFKTSGIILSILTIIISSFINRFACHLILRSARLSKRRNFENLAFSIFGLSGKLITEIGMLGFLIGGCVAFFVVIGDLGPSLITELFNIPNYLPLRTFTMMFLGMFIALPLGLRRRVDPSFSAISMCLYVLLVINLLFEAMNNFSNQKDAVFNKLNYWNFENYWKVLPIYITCLSCQPQLFEIFDSTFLFSEDKNSVKNINQTIKQAVFVCSFLYIAVGLFGYLAFFEKSIEGNILVDLPHSFFSILTKLGFILTIIFSLPLCLFPCRTSLHSLLYRKASISLLNEMTLAESYISDSRWLFLTVFLIVITICISIVIPHIEFILAILGSTTGAFVCLILPALCFLFITFKNTTERYLAYFVLYFGLIVFIFSTITLINVDPEEISSQSQIEKNLNLSASRIEEILEKNTNKIENQIEKIEKELNETKIQTNKEKSAFLNVIEKKKKIFLLNNSTDKNETSKNLFNKKTLNETILLEKANIILKENEKVNHDFEIKKLNESLKRKYTSTNILNKSLSNLSSNISDKNLIDFKNFNSKKNINLNKEDNYKSENTNENESFKKIENEKKENNKIENDNKENNKIENDNKENNKIENDYKENNKIENDNKENNKIENDKKENIKSDENIKKKENVKKDENFMKNKKIRNNSKKIDNSLDNKKSEILKKNDYLEKNKLLEKDVDSKNFEKSKANKKNIPIKNKTIIDKDFRK